GPPEEFTISVNPTPDIEVEVRDTICNEDDIVFNITNPNIPIIGNWRYRLEVNYGDSIVGTLPPVSEYADTELSIPDNLTNNGVKWHTATYRFIPLISSTWGGDDCENGQDTTITIWVNPTPAIRAFTEDSVICNGETAVIRIHNPNEFVLGAWEYDLFVTPDSAITCARDSVTTGMTDVLIEDVLTNSDTVVHKVEYRFIPTKTIDDGLICEGGTDTTIVIWVNPTPEIRVTASDLLICDEESVTLNVRNPNVDVRGEWKYDLIISKDSEEISGVDAGTEEFNADTSYIYTLTNSDTVAHQVTYRFVPRITPDDYGPDCGYGIDSSITITVYPTPEIRVTADPDTVICDGQYINFYVRNPNFNLSGWKYDLTVDADPEIIGASDPKTFNADDELSFEDQLFNTDNEVHKVVYHFIPRIEPEDGGADCENGKDTIITIWVNPTPIIAVDVPDTIVCDNETAVFSVTDGLGPVAGEWDKKYVVRAVYTSSNVTVVSRTSNVRDTLDVGLPISDSYVNHTNEVQPVIYFFSARIFDNRPGHIGGFCGNVPDTLITIWVNPTPRINVDIADTIFCDSALVYISVVDGLGYVEGIPVYDLEVNYTLGAVSGVISGNGENEADQNINNYLENETDTIQVITYHFTPRIRDDRLGHEGEYCNNGIDTTITIYLNPTPRIEYLLAEDTLCYDEGFVLITDSLVTTTHPLYYTLDIYNPDNMSNVNARPDSVAIANPWDESDILNPGLSVGTITYQIHPYISTKGCPGFDTTIVIKVNPEPVMEATPSDTAVCYNWGYNIPMSSEVISTTGDLRYRLTTGGYNPGNVTNVRGDGDYLIEHLNQAVINSGDSIEYVTYNFTPIILNARASGHCEGDPLPPKTVQVAPELKGNMTASTWIGGNNIQCYGLENGEIYPGVTGGYYIYPYVFDWTTLDGTSGSLEYDEGDQDGLGIGKYWFDVVDTIGCFFTDTITLTQPDTIVVDTTIVDAVCAHLNPDLYGGSIDITVTGGTIEYDYYWTGRYGFSSEDEDIFGIAGPYHLTVIDTNECEYDADYFIESAREIVISPNPSDFSGFEIMCNGDSTGYIDLSVAGGFPGYTLKVSDENSLDTVFVGDIPCEGCALHVGSLPAGIYGLTAFDDEGCYNPRVRMVTLSEPDTFTITRINPKPYHDTVDISCYGADNGVIDIQVTGSRSEDYPLDFLWSGGPDPHLVPTDSIQDSLSEGTYQVIVTDIENCVGTAEFTLIEPTEIFMEKDSIRDLNGWSITCNGDSDGFIEISSSGGILGHNYDWNTGAMMLPNDTQQDQYDLVAGTYNLTITDSIGCILDTSFTIIEPNLLDLDSIIPKYHDFAIACYGDTSGSIVLIPAGGADSLNNTYAWSSINGSAWDPDSMNQYDIGAGTYMVLITDINGCDSTWTFTLNEPTALVVDNLSSDSAYCADTETGRIYMGVSGGIPDYSYLWSNGQTEDSIENLLAGIYAVVITDQNACEKDTSIEVFEADRFSVVLQVTSDYNGVPISCTDSSDGTISLQPVGGTSPYIYIWSNGATTRDLVDISAGFYRVDIEDDHGCKDSAEVVITEPDPIDYSMQLQDPLCYNDSTGRLEFLVTGGTVVSLDDYQVTVNGRLTGPYIENLPQGTYFIRIEDLNDCFVETDAELIHPDSLELDFDTENAFCKDKPDGHLDLSIDGGTFPYHISWDRDLPANEDYFNDLYWGDYVATVTDGNNCVTVDTAYVGFTYASCLVIPNAFSPNGDGFNDIWIIEGIELYPNVELRIFDRWGSMVLYTGNAADEPWDGSFYGRVLPIDSYHYIIDLNNDEPPLTGNVTIVR
ncbi:MAG: gliding motility-associated C-terminal domain-containing protein, partial [Bacteroidales bacterium]|nr:gliding motility-associated C-terminal domain-containing protein [Bacteroidales bacterium]